MYLFLDTDACQDANTENISVHLPTQPCFLTNILEHNSQQKRSSVAWKCYTIWWFHRHKENSYILKDGHSWSSMSRPIKKTAKFHTVVSAMTGL